MLCKAFKVDRPDLVDISTERPPKYADAVDKLRDIFQNPEVKSPRSAMYQEGFDVERVKKKPKKNTLNPIKVYSGSPIKDWVNSGKKESAVTVLTANGKLARKRTTTRWTTDAR